MSQLSTRLHYCHEKLRATNATAEWLTTVPERHGLFRFFSNRLYEHNNHTLKLSVYLQNATEDIMIERSSFSNGENYAGAKNVTLKRNSWLTIGSILLESQQPVELEVHMEFRFYHNKHANCNCIPDKAFAFPSTKAEASMALESLSTNLEKQFLREETADVWFEIGNEVIPAHKWILMARVEVFEKMLASGMQEAQTNRIPITDTDSQTFQQMLKFVYCGQFPDDMESMADALLPLTEKYNIQELKDVCVSTLKTGVTKENVVQTLILADVYRCPDLVDHCVKQLEGWRAMIDKDALEPLKQYPHLLIEIITLKNS